MKSQMSEAILKFLGQFHADAIMIIYSKDSEAEKIKKLEACFRHHCYTGGVILDQLKKAVYDGGRDGG